MRRADGRVLLTGGGGMLGSALRRLAPGLFAAPTRRECDLLDPASLGAYLEREGPFRAFVHAAAKVGGIAANMADPVGFLEENLRINLHFLSAAREAGIRDGIYVGSSCMYPCDRTTPLREEDLLTGPLEPTNEGYALAKLTGLKLCAAANRSGPFRWRTLVAPNLYGPGDHSDPQRSHLVAAILTKARDAVARGSSFLEVWGSGGARREFLYVDDFAGFLLAALDRLDALPEVLNVGCGEDRTVLDYYRAGAAAAGFEGEFRTDPSRPDGMRRKLLDSSRAFALGWRPRTPLEEGLVRTLAHLQESVPS